MRTTTRSLRGRVVPRDGGACWRNAGKLDFPEFRTCAEGDRDPPEATEALGQRQGHPPERVWSGRPGDSSQGRRRVEIPEFKGFLSTTKGRIRSFPESMK